MNISCRAAAGAGKEQVNSNHSVQREGADAVAAHLGLLQDACPGAVTSALLNCELSVVALLHGANDGMQKLVSTYCLQMLSDIAYSLQRAHAYERMQLSRHALTEFVN
jgi:hypothetical protein